MNYDDWKLASPPENGDVSPCCGDLEYAEGEYYDEYISSTYMCSICKESFDEPIPDYEYEQNMRDNWAEDRMDEARLERE